jgi:SAM-dependent methyltransferase
MKKSLINLKKNYENNLKQYGYSYKAVGWKETDALKRYEIMTNLFLSDKKKKIILDLGCGLSHYFLYLKNINLKNLTYIGVDISDKMIEKSKLLYPKNLYLNLDVLHAKSKIPKFDYALMNGLFTQKLNYSDKVMFFFLKNILKKIFFLSKKGMAFNLLTPFPDWKNKKNFYPSIEIILKFIIKNLSKKIVINHNYKLFEYTIYVYK